MKVVGYGMRMSKDHTGACFSDRLVAKMSEVGSPSCVGIDPVVERLPGDFGERARGNEREVPGALLEFSCGVCEAVAGVAAAVKFQSACYERYGEGGVAALRRSIAHARGLGLVVILDAKRGDIGISAEHYAAAAFGEPFDADAITVNAYLGMDTIEAYLAHRGRGVFVLVRTSNTGSDAVQRAAMSDGRSVAAFMGALVAERGALSMGQSGLSDVGAVVGATKREDGAAMRACMTNQIFLVPGYGAQGGGVEDVRPMVREGARSAGEAGVLVTASRSVIYPQDGAGSGWEGDVRRAAERFAGELLGLFK